MANPEVRSYVQQAIKAVSAGTEQALLETAVKVTAQAKSLAPIDLGELKGSIMWKTAKADGLHTEGNKLSEPVKGLSAIVGTATEYGIYQEFGTRKMAPQPFLTPAANIVTGGSTYAREASKIMKNWVNKILPKGIGGAGIF